MLKSGHVYIYIYIYIWRRDINPPAWGTGLQSEVRTEKKLTCQAGLGWGWVGLGQTVAKEDSLDQGLAGHGQAKFDLPGQARLGLGRTGSDWAGQEPKGTAWSQGLAGRDRANKFVFARCEHSKEQIV